MELAELLKITVLLFTLFVFGNPMTLPESEVNVPPEVPEDMDLPSLNEPRATWLETKSLKTQFTDLVYEAIEDLVKEGRLSNLVLGEPTNAMKDKRGRFQGFCFRRTRSGRFLPYICWKDDNNS